MTLPTTSQTHAVVSAIDVRETPEVSMGKKTHGKMMLEAVTLT